MNRMFTKFPGVRRWLSGSVKRVASGADSLVVSEACVRRLGELRQQFDAPQVLRVQVEAGGCEGFQYKFDLVPMEEAVAPLEDDDLVVVESKPGDAAVVIDETSLGLVKGSTVDYLQEMIRSAFVIANNPNADSDCGCGHSFNIKL